jgi:hypothetical protein
MAHTTAPKPGGSPTRTLTSDSQLIQDYLQTAGILINTTASRAVAAFQNNEGESEAVVIDVNGDLQHVCREPLSDSGWNMYGLGAGFRWIAAVDSATLWALGLTDVNYWQNNHGRWTQGQIPLPNGQAAQELSIGIDGTVWALDDLGNAYAMAASPFQTPPTLNAGTVPVAIQDVSGLLHLFCIDQKGLLWMIEQGNSSGRWQNWTALNAPAGVSLAALAVGPNQDGRLQVFAVDTTGSLHTLYETAPGVWSAWNVLAPPAASPTITQLVVGQDPDGRLEVLAVGTDGTLRRIAQTAPNNGWGSWTSLGAPSNFYGTPDLLALGQESDGRLIVLVGGTGLTSLSAIEQTTPGNGWNGWGPIANSESLAPKITALAVARDSIGRLQVFIIYPLGEYGPGVWYSSEQSPNGAWNNWQPLGGPSGSAIVTLTVGENADGRLELYSVDSSGNVWHNPQSAPGSNEWEGWTSLGSPAGTSLKCITILRDLSGRQIVLGVTPQGVMWQCQQTGPNAGWGSWTSPWWTWTAVNAPALTHAPAGAGSNCWAVGATGSLVYWNGTLWDTVALPQSKPAAWVSVGSDGSVWALDTGGILYKSANGNFQALPGALPGVAYFSANGAANIWATAAPNAAAPKSYSLFQYTNGTWQPVPTPPLHGDWNPPQCCVASDGSLCVLDGTGTAWRQTASTWMAKKIGAHLQSISADVPTSGAGAAWAVDDTGTFWRNFGSCWVERQSALPGGAIPTQVSVGTDGTVWALDDAGILYVKNGLSWSIMGYGPPPFQQPPGGTAGTFWAVDRSGNLIYWDGSGGWITSGLPAGATRANSVSVGTDGSVWMLASMSTGVTAAYRYDSTNGTWGQAGANLAQAPVGTADDLWCVTLTGSICRSSNGGQTWSTDAGAPTGVAQLTVCPDGAVWARDVNGTAWINPAWQRIMRPTGMAGWQGVSQCTSIAAGCDENGFRYVFFTNQQGAFNYTFEALPHTWIDPENLLASGVSHLGLTNQQDTGELIAYATFSAQLLAARRQQAGSAYFSVTSYVFQSPEQMSWLDVDLCAVDADHWYWFALEPLRNNLDLAVSSAQNTALAFLPIGNAALQTVPAFSRIVHLPWIRPPQAPFVAAVDDSGNVQLIALSSLTPQRNCYWEDFLALTGSQTVLPAVPIAVAAVLQSDDGAAAQPRMYATIPMTSGGATTEALWVLRQVDASVPLTQAGAWSPWIPLGGGYTMLAIGPSLQDTDALFAVASSDGSLHQIAQDPITGKWTDLEVDRPSLSGDEIDDVAMYTTQMTLMDLNGVPQGGVPVTITAATLATLWIDNTIYAVDADQGVSYNTDATGNIQIRTLATDLHVPTLMVQAEGLSETQSIYPPQHVHDFLAGTGQLAVGGGLPASFTVSTIQSQWPNVSQESATDTVSYASQIAAMPNSTMPAATGIVGWAADCSNPTSPISHVFHTREELTAYRQALACRQVVGGLPGSIWDDIKHAAEDVVHAVKKGVVKVDHIAIDAEHKIVSLTLYVGQTLAGTFEFAVHTIEDAVHAIEVVLKTLIADIKEIIEWLMLLFKWKDIWETKEKLESFLLQAVSIVQQEIGAARTAAQGLFTSVKSELQTDFNALIASLQSGSFPYNTFSDLPQWPSDGNATMSRSGRLSAASAALPSPGSIAHSGWLLFKALRNITPSLNFGPTAAIDLQELTAAMNAQTLLADIQQAITDFENYLTKLFTNPGKFAELTLVAVLEEIKDLVFVLLDLLDDLVQVFLDLVEQLIGVLHGWFNQHLDIPVISQLYKFITGLLGHSESLTVLHLFALLMAIPLTIVHKLVFNGQKPYDGIDATAVRAGTVRSPSLTPADEAILWNQAYLIVGWIYAGFAGARDGFAIALKPGVPPDPVMQCLRGLTDAAAWIERINSWPGMFPNLSQPDGTAAKWLLANWCVYWFPPFVDAAFLRTDVPQVRIPCQFVLGIAALITFYVAANKETLNGCLVAQNVIQPWPLLLSLLMLPSVRSSIIDSTDGLGDPAILNLVADGLINLGFVTLHYVGVSES